MTEQLLIVISLVIVGYVLLLLELLVIPGFGIPGVLGIAGLAAASVFAFRFFGGGVGTFVVVGVVATTTGILWWIPRSRGGRHLIHRDSLAGATSGQSDVLIGDRGVAETDLRPAGVGRFGEQRESVVTEGEYVAANAVIEVILVEGGRVVVVEIPTGADEGGS